MFKDMKIGARLGLGFGALLLLLTIVSGLGVLQMAKLNGSMKFVVEDKYPKTVIINDISIRVLENCRYLRNIIILTDQQKIDAYKAKYDENVVADNENFKALDQKLKVPAARELFKTMQADLVDYRSLASDVLALALAGKKQEAAKELFGERSQAQDKFLDSVRKLADFQGNLMDEAEKSDAEQYAWGRNITVGLAVGALLFGVGLAIWITRAITRPMGQALDVAQRLAEGDLTVRIDSNSK
ncbi:MAG: MCP four helix bundle domain-containing protein, partial [Steroidobacteraceae bacterium]